MLLCGSLVILLVTAGCSASTPPSESPPKEDPCADIESAVQDWVQDNVTELSKEIGSLVTRDLPVVRAIAAKAIETALLAWLEFSVEDVEPLKSGDRCSARVKLEFPLEMQIPLVGKKGYRVSLEYDVIVEKGEVTDSDIDISSFKMTETSD